MYYTSYQPSKRIVLFQGTIADWQQVISPGNLPR
jgi:hypothetical protein